MGLLPVNMGSPDAGCEGMCEGLFFRDATDHHAHTSLPLETKRLYAQPHEELRSLGTLQAAGSREQRCEESVRRKWLLDHAALVLVCCADYHRSVGQDLHDHVQYANDQSAER